MTLILVINEDGECVELEADEYVLITRQKESPTHEMFVLDTNIEDDLSVVRNLLKDAQEAMPESSSPNFFN